MKQWKQPDLQNPFYGKIKKLVIPIVIQNLLSATVNSTDVVMLNYLCRLTGGAICHHLVHGLLWIRDRSDDALCTILWKERF